MGEKTSGLKNENPLVWDRRSIWEQMDKYNDDKRSLREWPTISGISGVEKNEKKSRQLEEPIQIKRERAARQQPRRNTGRVDRDEAREWKKRWIWTGTGIAILVLAVVIMAVTLLNGNHPAQLGYAETEGSGTEQYSQGASQTEMYTEPPETEPSSEEGIDLAAIVMPDYVTVDLIEPNVFSRPQKPLPVVNDIVVHYVGNPNTSAHNNVEYFKSLGEQSEDDENARYASSHFVIGLEGEIIQCVPLYEVSYCSNNRNSDTIAIECCHPDETGEFTEATYQSLIRLLSFLCSELELDETHIIRHYDVTGKCCPKYYVDHEDAWEALKLDVRDSLQAGAQP